jgi:hypothetical protein
MDGNNWAGAGASILGMIAGHQAQRRQHRDTKELMGMQFRNQLGLNRQGHEMQMDMWNKTNYKAQVDHMLEAGLNPALMYGSAGQGGTTGSQGGGSASMGQAQQMKAMDMSNLMMGAQMDALKAKANLDNAQATKISGVDTELGKQSIKKIIAEAKTEEEKAELVKLQGIFQKITNMREDDRIFKNIEYIGQQTRNLKQQYKLTEDQYEGLVNEAIGNGLKALNGADLIKAQTKLTNSEEQALWEKLDIMYDELMVKQFDTEAKIKSADANMIRAKVEETMEPLKLDFQKKKMWVDNATKLISNIIGIAGNLVPSISKVTKM